MAVDQFACTEVVTADMTFPSFYHAELGRALTEQSFGLIRYEFGPCSAYEASAAVTLLEGTEVRVELNARGYRVDGETYETIEGLLQAISPMYVRKREEMIITRLQGL